MKYEVFFLRKAKNNLISVYSKTEVRASSKNLSVKSTVEINT